MWVIFNLLHWSFYWPFNLEIPSFLESFLKIFHGQFPLFSLLFLEFFLEVRDSGSTSWEISSTHLTTLMSNFNISAVPFLSSLSCSLNVLS